MRQTGHLSRRHKRSLLSPRRNEGESGNGWRFSSHMNQRPRVHHFHRVFGQVSRLVYIMCLAHQKPFRESYNFILKRRELNSFVWKLSPLVSQCDEKQPHAGGSPARDDFRGKFFFFPLGKRISVDSLKHFYLERAFCAGPRQGSHLNLLSPSC